MSLSLLNQNQTQYPKDLTKFDILWLLLTSNEFAMLLLLLFFLSFESLLITLVVNGFLLMPTMFL